MRVHTLRQQVHSFRGHHLYHYPSQKTQSASLPPVLIIYALVNRPTILDIHPKRSFIQALTEQGLDVYLLVWHQTSLPDQNASLSHYICEDIFQAVECIGGRGSKVHLMGVCQGGYFSTCYAALYPEHIASLITLVTPFDFETPDCRLLQMLKYVDVGLAIQRYGNVPGAYLDATLNLLQPFRMMHKRWQAGLFERSELYAAVEAWRQDCPDVPGKMCYEFATQCVQQNALLKGTLQLKGKTVNLNNLQPPLLNIYAENDHIWPPSCSRGIANHYTGERYQEIAFSGGHIGVFISRQAHQKIPVEIGAWVLGIG